MASPTKVISSGKISVAEFDGQYGSSFKFQKSYLDKNEKWVNSDFLGLADLMDVANLCQEVLRERIKIKGESNTQSEPPI